MHSSFQTPCIVHSFSRKLKVDIIFWHAMWAPDEGNQMRKAEYWQWSCMVCIESFRGQSQHTQKDQLHTRRWGRLSVDSSHAWCPSHPSGVGHRTHRKTITHHSKTLVLLLLSHSGKNVRHSWSTELTFLVSVTRRKGRGEWFDWVHSVWEPITHRVKEAQ